MNKQAALEKLTRQRDEASHLARGSPEFKRWRRNTELAIEHIFGAKTRHLGDFQGVSFTPGSYSMTNPEPAFDRAFYAGVGSAKAVLQSMIEEIEEYRATRVSRPDRKSIPLRG